MNDTNSMTRLSQGPSNPSGQVGWTAFPITYKYIDISTAHITKQDDEMLTACMNNLRPDDVAPAGYQFEHGFWLWIGLGNEWATLARREGSEFSEAFVNLFERAIHSDADWMKIDCDGMTYNDLPLYEW